MTAHPRLPSATLPPPHGRWTVATKEELVRQVEAGEIALDDARVRFGVTTEEFLDWQQRLSRRGRRGLQQRFIADRFHG